VIVAHLAAFGSAPFVRGDSWDDLLDSHQEGSIKHYFFSAEHERAADRRRKAHRLPFWSNSMSSFHRYWSLNEPQPDLFSKQRAQRHKRRVAVPQAPTSNGQIRKLFWSTETREKKGRQALQAKKKKAVAISLKNAAKPVSPQAPPETAAASFPTINVSSNSASQSGFGFMASLSWLSSIVSLACLLAI
jgi:hypothetical protein